MSGLMRDVRLAVVLGFVMWFMVFFVQSGILLKDFDRASLDTLSGSTSVTLTFLLSFYYFREGGNGLILEGVMLGLLWLVMSVALDFAFFVPKWGLSIYDYMMTIGISYVSMPLIAGAVGFSKEKRQS